MISKHKILFCFHKLKKGGGQNVALNFLQGVSKLDFNLKEHEFVVVKNSAIHERLIELGVDQFHFAPGNPIKSILWEAAFSFFFIKTLNVEVCYTYFGYSNFVFSNIPQVSGSADSNLFYPEIDFWEGDTSLVRIKKNLIDSYRKYGLKSANGVIFENRALMEQGQRLFSLSKTVFIMPSISKYSLACTNLRRFGKKNAINLLFLCGWQRNKGVLIIPDILYEAKRRNINIHVTLTAGNIECPLSKSFLSMLQEKGVEDLISIVNPVGKAELPVLYNDMDVVMLLSKLESFSNNIIESWSFRRPLVVADEPWSRSICKNGAAYVSRQEVASILDVIEELQNPLVSDVICNQGDEELTKYHSIERKTELELDYVDYIAKNG